VIAIFLPFCWPIALSSQLSAFSFQLSALSFQLSAFSSQLSAFSFQLSAFSFQLIPRRKLSAFQCFCTGFGEKHAFARKIKTTMLFGMMVVRTVKGGFCAHGDANHGEAGSREKGVGNRE
jgi:hypothetical protein